MLANHILDKATKPDDNWQGCLLVIVYSDFTNNSLALFIPKGKRKNDLSIMSELSFRDILKDTWLN